MGFLKVFGRALLWDESKPHQKTVKDNAVKVIINAIKAEKQCRPQFGYEFEFHKIIIDDQAKKVYLDLFVKVVPKWRDKEKFLTLIFLCLCAFRRFSQCYPYPYKVGIFSFV